jgi:RNA polymerase sigma factor (sigma-70 family)
MTILPMLEPQDSIPTRYSLLSRLRDWGDQESWRAFFDTYWRLIYSVALKSGLTESEAQDVVQETVICVAKDIEKFKRERRLGSFKAWLRQITRWRIADQLRKRSPAPTPSGPQSPRALDELLGSAEAELEAVWEREWQKNLFEAALTRVKRSVKEEYYQIFDLYILKEWPAGKVARTLRINLGLVYLAKHRVASVLKKELRALEKEI